LHVASALMATLLSIAAGLASRDTRLVMREVLLHFAIVDTYFGDDDRGFLMALRLAPRDISHVELC
jgi:hypothetical protein